MKFKTEKSRKKVKETKSWSFEKIINIDKILARLTKKKREKTHITNTRIDVVDNTTDPINIKKIIRNNTHIHMTTYMKWVSSSKSTNYHNSHTMKETILIAL